MHRKLPELFGCHGCVWDIGIELFGLPGQEVDIFATPSADRRNLLTELLRKKENKQINRLAGIRLLGKLMFVDFKRQM